MDSAGLAMLMNTLRRLGYADRRLLVVCPAGPLRRTLEIAAISRHLELHETGAEAVDTAGEDVR
jgi:anti-anti-sigma regulatory factor